jgi:hypothetical protein
MSGRKASRKRGAADSVASAGAPAANDASQAPAKRRRLPAGALAEGDLPLDAEHPSVKEREFWEQFHTDLLRCWFTDYSDWKKRLNTALVVERSKLLDAFVQSSVPRPPGADMPAIRSAIEKVFLRRHPGVSLPGEWPPEQPAAAAAVAARAPASGGSTPRRSHVVVVDDDEELGDEEDDSDVVAPAPRKPPPSLRTKSTAPAAPIVVDHDWQDGCLTCGIVPPESAIRVNKQGFHIWLCAVCGIRGDLPASHESNVVIRENKMLTKGQSAPAAAAGQTTTSSSSDSAPTDKLEKHLLNLTNAVGEPHPLFAKTYPRPTPQQAVDTVRLALGASTTAPPSAQLLALIQSGKYFDLGFAVPRPFLVDKAGVDSLATISFGAGGPVLDTTKDPTKTLPLASLNEFFSALICTILPSLIERPEAMVQWMAFARTVLNLASKESWAVARSYIDATLHHRLGRFKKDALAPPYEAALTDIRFAATASAAPSPSGQRAPAAGAKCHAFQTPAGCQRANCPFAHLCASCAQQHAASSRPGCVTNWEAQKAAAAARASTGGKGPRRAGGSGSTRSAPTAGSSAASVSTAAPGKTL